MSAALRIHDLDDRLAVSVRAFLEQNEAFTRTMSARDQMLVHLGRESARVEEALEQGDFGLAEIHLATISTIVDSLGEQT